MGKAFAALLAAVVLGSGLSPGGATVGANPVGAGVVYAAAMEHGALSNVAAVSGEVALALVPAATALNKRVTASVPCGRCQHGLEDRPGGLWLAYWYMSGEGCDTEFWCSVCTGPEEHLDDVEAIASSYSADEGGAETQTDASQSTHPTSSGAVRSTCTPGYGDSGAVDFETAVVYFNYHACYNWSCNESELLVEEALAAVKVAGEVGAERLAELILASDGMLKWNEERSAVQGGCREGVTTIHIPVDTPTRLSLLHILNQQRYP